MNTNEKSYDLIKFVDGDFSLDVKVSPNEDTVWLTIKEMSKLFERDLSVIGKHIRSVIRQGEVNKESVWAKFAYTASDGKIYSVDYYNLDMIIAVGYRVKSKRGIQFRRWATYILKQYLLKGYVINEERCLSCTSTVFDLQSKYKELESKIKDLNKTIYSDNNKLFYEGEIIDAYTFLRKLFFLAKESITRCRKQYFGTLMMKSLHFQSQKMSLEQN